MSDDLESAIYDHPRSELLRNPKPRSKLDDLVKRHRDEVNDLTDKHLAAHKKLKADQKRRSIFEAMSLATVAAVKKSS